MLDQRIPINSTQLGPPLSAFRFLVTFFGIGDEPVPNPVDIRFKSVSGLKFSLKSKTDAHIGGQRVGKPEKTGEETLTLSRGFIPGPSPLRMEIEIILMKQEKEVKPRDILVIAMDDVGFPMASWLVKNAKMTEYTVSGFDADQNGLLIETMQFTYMDIIQLSI